MDRSIPIILSPYLPKDDTFKPEIFGICDYCGTNTNLMPFKKVISTNNKEQNMFYGNGFCQSCYSVMKYDNLRKKSFIFAKDNFIYPKFTEVYNLFQTYLVSYLC